MRNDMIASIVVGVAAACSGDSTPSGQPADASATVDSIAAPSFSFFITSTGHPNGGNFGGLAGADDFCRAKAAAAVPAAAVKTWRAYLSTTAENAKDRIGAGPWFNRNGVEAAASVAALHAAGQMTLNKRTSLDENGAVVNGRGDTPNHHDILTGSTADGVVAANAHCNNWTSGDDTFVGRVGHHDRMGGGDAPTSWGSAHATNGCSVGAFPPQGGRGSIYCFAID